MLVFRAVHDRLSCHLDDHLLHNQEKHKQIVCFAYHGLLWDAKKCFWHPEDIESDKKLKNLISYMGLAACLLFAGMFLRAKVPVFRKLLPASVIGGFVGLLLGPQVLGDNAILKFSTDCVSTWSLIPGVLILPIFASVPLGDGMNEPPKPKGEFKRNLPKVLAAGGCFGATAFLQSVVGFGMAILFVTFMPSIGLYKNFGYELTAGFSGGHGTAGAIGGLLQQFGVAHWEVAQGMATTFATMV